MDAVRMRWQPRGTCSPHRIEAELWHHPHLPLHQLYIDGIVFAHHLLLALLRLRLDCAVAVEPGLADLSAPWRFDS